MAERNKGARPRMCPDPKGSPIHWCHWIARSTGEQCRNRAGRGYGTCTAHRRAIEKYQRTCPGCGEVKPRISADCNFCGGSYPIPSAANFFRYE